jgi:hypothetical protein
LGLGFWHRLETHYTCQQRGRREREREKFEDWLDGLLGRKGRKRGKVKGRPLSGEVGWVFRTPT